MPSHWRSTARRAASGDSPDLLTIRRYLLGDEPFPSLGTVGGETIRLHGMQLCQLGFLDDTQGRAGGQGVQRVAIAQHWRPACMVLFEQRVQERGTLENEPLGRVDHPIDDAAFQQLAASANHHPTKPGEPAPVVKGAQETLDVRAVLHQDVDVQSVRACQLFARIGTADPGTGRSPQNASRLRQFGHDADERRPHAAERP